MNGVLLVLIVLVIGAIGVAGAPGGNLDAQCADAVLEENAALFK